MKKGKISEETKKVLITYGIVVVTYIVVQILIAAGLMSYQMQDFWFPFVIMRYWLFP